MATIETAKPDSPILPPIPRQEIHPHSALYQHTSPIDYSKGQMGMAPGYQPIQPTTMAPPTRSPPPTVSLYM